MVSALYLLIYLACGVVMIRWLLPRRNPVARIWMGMSLGLLLLMWLPALCAFFMKFTMAAHWTALVPLALLTCGSWLLRDRHPARGWDEEEKLFLWHSALLVLPLTVLGGYLQYTHCLRPDEWGGLSVGQSTYGDLPMHLAFITSLPGKPFPPDYSFMPGVQLSYPFLTDSMSSSLLMMGWGLNWSVVIPGTLMMALCYMGVMILGRDMTGGKKLALIAGLLFFLNGGLGFLYDFDMAGGTEWDGTPVLWQRIQHILTGFYTTPTNQPDPNNLRWSNVIADLMIPQRTLLGGWCMVLPCFYILWGAFDSRLRQERGSLRALLLLGFWGGALPLIHTHSFLALGLCSAGFMCYDLLHEREERLPLLKRYLLYGAVAVGLAAPQLILFTFRQAFSGQAGGGFLSLHFNWVNNTAEGGIQLRDMYFWFYIKNIGLPFIALLLALFEKNSTNRRIFSGALPIILAAELVRFQPNVYDNNKLLYLAWILCCMIVVRWCRGIWNRLKGLRARPFIAAWLAVVTFLSAGLTLWREVVSDYQAFGSNAVELADWVRENTDGEDVFLTGTQHLNPVASLAGRTIVCGPDLWLYFHGLDTTQRKEDIRRFMEDPANNTDVLTAYDVSYIMVSSYERSDYQVDTEALEAAYEVVFSNWESTIYKVPEG